MVSHKGIIRRVNESHLAPKEWYKIMKEVNDSQLDADDIIKSINNKVMWKNNKGGRPSKILWYLRRIKRTKSKENKIKIIDEARRMMSKPTFRKMMNNIK